MTGKQREHNTIKAMLGHLTDLEADLEEDEVEVLGRVFRSNTFKSLLKVEKGVESVQSNGPSPVTKKAFMEAKLLYLQLRRKRRQSSLIGVLLNILEDPHIQALLSTHDLIANERLIPIIDNIDEESRTQIKSIRIQKKPAEPLGATIRRDPFSDRIAIARIFHGGAAHRTGSLKKGDQILEINGVETNDMSLDAAVSLLGLHSEIVEFKLLSSEESAEDEEDREKVFLRAHFNYNPREDPNIPCKDAGLAFNKGDVLEIIDSSEPKWWQARKYGTKSAKYGLIPSRQLQEKRLSLRLWSPSNSFNGEIEACSGSLSPRERNCLNNSRSESPTQKASKKKPKKVKYKAMQSEKFHAEEIIFYEEVTQIMADFDRRRPIVITGVPVLECEDLKERLIQTNAEKFRAPVPYTSRTRKSLEKVNKDYHYISRNDMEKGIRLNSFINVEVFKGHFFAISIDSVMEIANSGKTCVLYINPESLPVLCSTNLHPFVVFIKAPDIEILKTNLKAKQESSLFESKIMTDEEVYKALVDSEEIENNYGHYFDLVLTMEDMETTLNQLYHSVHRMETEPLWIPLRWQ